MNKIIHKILNMLYFFEIQINKSKNLVLMKKVDYSVHILVEEVKSIPQLNENHLRYPVVKLTVFNKSKRTEKTKLHC